MTEQQQYQITEYAQRCRALDASALAHCRFSVRLFRDILEISLEKQPFPPRMHRSTNDSICSLLQYLSQPRRGARGGLPTGTRTCAPAFRSKA